MRLSGARLTTSRPPDNRAAAKLPEEQFKLLANPLILLAFSTESSGPKAPVAKPQERSKSIAFETICCVIPTYETV